MIVDCPYCGRPHESINSAANHAWKSQDGHPVRELDDAILAVVDAIDGEVEPDEYSNERDSTGESDSADESDEPPQTTPGGKTTGVNGGKSTGGDGTTPNGETTVTDGGAQEVPSFGTPDDDLEDDVQEDLGSVDQDGCPKCGEDGELVEDLRGRDDVPGEVVDALEAEGDRWCPNCSTSETAEVW